MNSDNKIAGKVPIVVAILAVLAALYFFSSTRTMENDIAAARTEKIISEVQLSRYQEIDKHYGRASDNFYSSKAIVILRGNGASEIIPVYFYKGDVNLTARYEKSKIDVQWEKRNDNWRNLKITSKIDRGYHTIDFTNKENDEKFSVLIIVK